MNELFETLLNLWPVIATIVPAGLTAYFNIKNNAQKINILRDQINEQRETNREAFEEMKQAFISDANTQGEIHLMRLENAKNLHEEALMQTETMLTAKVKILSEGMLSLKEDLQKMHSEYKEMAHKVSVMETKMETILSYAQSHTDK